MPVHMLSWFLGYEDMGPWNKMTVLGKVLGEVCIQVKNTPIQKSENDQVVYLTSSLYFICIYILSLSHTPMPPHT